MIIPSRHVKFYCQKKGKFILLIKFLGSFIKKIWFNIYKHRGLLTSNTGHNINTRQAL